MLSDGITSSNFPKNIASKIRFFTLLTFSILYIRKIKPQKLTYLVQLMNKNWYSRCGTLDFLRLYSARCFSNIQQIVLNVKSSHFVVVLNVVNVPAFTQMACDENEFQTSWICLHDWLWNFDPKRYLCCLFFCCFCKV